jgi:NAD(P)-binding Rossmann-like domain
VIRTDYLVIGSGASGLAFADALVDEISDVELTLIDRRPGPGGHWLEAYPFVRLHTPSAYYGVNSLVLGEDRIDHSGENAGFYERATGDEVRDYFAEVATRLMRTGRVRTLTEHEHLGGGEDGERVRDLSTGAVHDVSVRRKLVDARYLEASVPATHTPSFEVAAGAALVPVNDLPDAARPAARYTVLGSGKTAVDACTWLLANDVAPDRIRWVRPRDAWFHHRRHFQPLALVGEIMAGISLDAEAAAEAADLDDLFDRLQGLGRLIRIDPSARATMYRLTMLGPAELDAVRQIEDVVRLGYVRRLESDRVLLERGEIDEGHDTLNVDCTAYGLRNAPATPIFQDGRIVLQQVRQNSPTFNAALVAFVEAHREDDVEKNRLCPPNPYPSSIDDWPGMSRRTWQVEQRWLREQDVSAWIAESRLNLLRGLPDHAAEPPVKAALERFLTHIGPAIERLQQLEA